MFLVLLAMVAYADDAQLRMCAQQDGDAAQLSCFRALDEARSGQAVSAAPAPAAAPPESSAWVVGVNKDPMTDSARPYASLYAERVPGDGEPPMMLVTCAAGEIAVAVTWQQFLGVGPTASGRVRYDDRAPQPMTWRIGASGRGVSFMTDGRTQLADITTASRLTAQVIRSVDGALTAAWNLAGASSALSGVQAACR